MKKILIVLIALLCLVGCGSKSEPECDGRIAELLDAGFNLDSSTLEENVWKGLFNLEDTEYIVLKADLTEEQYNKLNDVFFEEDKYMEEVRKLNVSYDETVTDAIPSVEELQKYVGMTIGEIEDEGFERTGYCECENGQYSFILEGLLFSMNVKNSADMPIDDMDNFSENDIRALVVSEVTHSYPSSNLLSIK